MDHRRHTQVDSPVGSLTLVATDAGLCGLYMVDQRHRPPDVAFGVADPTAFSAAAEQLEAYFGGERAAFDLPLAPVGTSFQLDVWAALRRIPYGRTVSYGRIARDIGRPRATRAVGMACGANPIGVVVPCHRVVGSTGRLTGYGGGLERKRFLLDLERRAVAPELLATGAGRLSSS